MSNLRINLDDLLHARAVESERIEFKATWDSRATGYQVLKTICAFANDLRRHGSGYVVLGVAEKDGRGDVIQEKEFQGGLTEQVRGCLDYLRREVIGSRIDKAPDRVRASNRPNYPEDALREVLVNALFHRGYGNDVPHTTLVRVTSDRIDIRSTPGPVAGIDLAQLQPGAIPRLVPPRNPRIGGLFKEVGLAEKRLTGLGKVHQAMERNGSPPPQFFFDERRTFFQATLFAHPWQSADQRSAKPVNCGRWDDRPKRWMRWNRHGAQTQSRILSPRSLSASMWPVAIRIAPRR